MLAHGSTPPLHRSTPLCEGGGEACLSSMPESAARQERLCRWQGQEAMEAVWRSVHPHHPTWQILTTTINAVLLSLRGLSMPRIALLLRVSAPAVLTWIRTCVQEHTEKPEPTRRTIVLERVRCGMTSRRHGRNSGSGKPWSARLGSGSTGRVGGGTRRRGRRWSASITASATFGHSE